MSTNIEQLASTDKPESFTSMLDGALWWASQGCKVFPIKEGCKHPPLVKFTTEATSDPEQIIQWWNQWPGANVGIRTGDGYIVMDVDGTGESTLELLCSMSHPGPLPPTRKVRTPSGGLHLYYRVEKPLGNVQVYDGAGHDEIRIKSQNAYVVTWPSRYLNGTGSGLWTIIDDREPVLWSEKWRTFVLTETTHTRSANPPTISTRRQAAELVAAFCRTDSTKLGYHDWIRQSYILFYELGDDAFELFCAKADEWADYYGKRHAKPLRDVWEHLHPKGVLNVATLYHFANIYPLAQVGAGVAQAAQAYLSACALPDETEAAIEAGAGLAASIGAEQAAIVRTQKDIIAQLVGKNACDLRAWTPEIKGLMGQLGITESNFARIHFDPDLARVRNDIILADLVRAEGGKIAYAAQCMPATRREPLTTSKELAYVYSGTIMVPGKTVDLKSTDFLEYLAEHHRNIRKVDGFAIHVGRREAIVNNEVNAWVYEEQKTWQLVEYKREVGFNQNHMGMWLRQLRHVAGNEGSELILDAFAYQLQGWFNGSNDVLCWAVMLCSDEQNIGKSTVISLFQHLAGQFHYHQFDSSEAGKFMMSWLWNKYVINLDEAGFDIRRGTGLIDVLKKLLPERGKDRMVSIEAKGKGKVNVKVCHPLVIGTTNMPGKLFLDRRERRCGLFGPDEGYDAAVAHRHAVELAQAIEADPPTFAADVCAALLGRRVGPRFDANCAPETNMTRRAIRAGSTGLLAFLREIIQDGEPITLEMIKSNPKFYGQKADDNQIFECLRGPLGRRSYKWQYWSEGKTRATGIWIDAAVIQNYQVKMEGDRIVKCDVQKMKASIAPVAPDLAL